ncbi:hypothetical protein DDT54_23125 [Brenneria nigrifluens DSM 30175 = ATCC 13028]|nr:hypothetical protein DDT54_23125 [Brenneria nigrifluens DSM 30175 = ATCC 13028]
MKNIFKYIFVFFYFSLAFFLLGLLVRIVLGFIHLNKFYLSYEGVMSNLVKSLIAGGAITLAAIAFNLIDKYKARKRPPSAPE